MSNTVVMAQDDRIATLERDYVSLRMRMTILENFVGDKFCETFREYTIRRGAYFGSGGGGFSDGFNPRSNGRYDSFEDSEANNERFGERQNGRRSASFDRRSSTSTNASHTNVSSNKRSRGGTKSSGIRKRCKLSVAANLPQYLTRQPSIEYHPSANPTVDVEETVTSSRLQILNGENMLQRNDNDNYNILIEPEMAVGASAQHPVICSNDEIETENTFGTPQTAENHLEVNSNEIETEENAAPNPAVAELTSNAANNECTVLNTTITIPNAAAGETTGKSFNSFAIIKADDENIQVQDNLSNTNGNSNKNLIIPSTNDHCIFLLSEPEAVADLQPPLSLDVATTSTASDAAGTTENLVIAESQTPVPSVTAAPLTFTEQLQNSRVVDQSVPSRLATDLQTVAPAAVNQSTESNETDATSSPTSLGVDSSIISVKDDVSEAPLTTESLAGAPFSTTPLESAVSSAAPLNVDKDTSGLHASLNGYMEMPADAIEVGTCPKSPTCAEDSLRPAEIPESDILNSAPSTALGSSSVVVAQSEDSMDSDSTQTSSFTARASLSCTNDSDIEIIDELSDSTSRGSDVFESENSNERSTSKNIRRSNKSQQRAKRRKSASSEASVITLSSGGNSDAESKDNVSISSSSKRKETTNSLNIVVVPPNGHQHNRKPTLCVLKRLKKCYPTTNANLNCATKDATVLTGTHLTISPKRTPKPFTRFLSLKYDRPQPISLSHKQLNRAELLPRPQRGLSNESQLGTMEDEDLIDTLSESSITDDVIVGKKSRVSAVSKSKGKTANASSGSDNGNVGVEKIGDNESDTSKAQDHDAMINVDGDSNNVQRSSSGPNTITENETNMLLNTNISEGVDDLNVSNTSVYRCQKLNHETRVVITRKPASLKPCPSVPQIQGGKMRNRRSLSGAQNGASASLSINMDSLDVSRKGSFVDIAAISPDGQPPPLIPIDDEGRSDGLENGIEVLDDVSSNDQVDEPTMPILSVSASQTALSLEKTIELDETMSDEESLPLRQSIPKLNTLNSESHNFEHVNRTLNNPYMVDPARPFFDGGSDRKCKRKTFRCTYCDTSFFTQNELDEHVLEHAQEELESDPDYDSQNQEYDSSYTRRSKHQQRRSVRSKKSSLAKVVELDSDSESEQTTASSKNSEKNKTSARAIVNGQSDMDRENVLCPYCKTIITKRSRRAHTKSSGCSLTVEQFHRESRFKGKLKWVPVPGHPTFLTWSLPTRTYSQRKVNQPDDLNFNDVSNDMSEVQENAPDSPDVNLSLVIPTSPTTEDLVHAGPSKRIPEPTITKSQFSRISSAVVIGGRKENGISESYVFSPNGSCKRKSRHGSNPEKLTRLTDSSNSVDSKNLHAAKRTRSLSDGRMEEPEEVNRGDYDHSRIFNMTASPSPDVYDELLQEHDLNQPRDLIRTTNEQVSFQTNNDDLNVPNLHNQSVLTEEVHSEYDDQSSATEEFPAEEISRGGGDPSTRKNFGHEIVQCPQCGKSMLQKSLLRHTARACPVQSTRKAKNSSFNARKLVCKYEDCGFIPSNSNQYREHLVVHPIGEGTACKFKKCGQIFIEELNLLDHDRTHLINVPHDATGVSIIEAESNNWVSRSRRSPAKIGEELKETVFSHYLI